MDFVTCSPIYLPNISISFTHMDNSKSLPSASMNILQHSVMKVCQRVLSQDSFQMLLDYKNLTL